MEQKHNLVLQGTETFSRGALDNLALENGNIVLDSVAGRYLQYGCYTTPGFAMPPFCNLQVSWNAQAPANTVIEAQCRVYVGNSWTNWMSFGKWAPDYPRRSVRAQSEDGQVFLLGDTVTVAAPGGATAVQLQVSLSTNDEKVTPSVRLLAAAVRPLVWEKQEGAPINRTLYLPEYSLAGRDPSFGAGMDLPLVIAALMNRCGEDILPEEVAYTMVDGATMGSRNAAYAVAAAGSCGYSCWQAWLDLKELRTQIHDNCPVAVEMERGGVGLGLRESANVWMGLRGFGHDDVVHADYVLLNDPTAHADGAVARTMALTDFLRYYTGRAIVLRPRPRGVWGTRPNRLRCELVCGDDDRTYYFTQHGAQDDLPESFFGWVGCTVYDGVAHATTAHKTFRRMECTGTGGILFPQDVLEAGGRCTVYAVDQTGTMRVAELRLPRRVPAPQTAPAPQNTPAGE
jgi:hypothetical protein